MNIKDTLRYRVWRALKTKPMSAVGMAEIMGADKSQMTDVYRRLRDSGHITFPHREGKEVVYKASAINLPTTGRPKGRATRVRGAAAPRRPSDGFGAGRHPLDDVWR